MIALLVLWLLDSPTELHPCLTACAPEEWGAPAHGATRVCWYAPAPRCDRECVDDGEIECRPEVVNLGAWDPIPYEVP